MSWDLATPFVIDLQVAAEDIDASGTPTMRST